MPNIYLKNKRNSETLPKSLPVLNRLSLDPSLSRRDTPVMSLTPITVTFLTQSDEDGASARLRVYALRPYLEKLNVRVQVSPAVPGQSTLQYLKIAAQRLKEKRAVSKQSDVIVIQRDLINHMKPWLENAYARSHVPLVFDIDDAIDLRPPGFPKTWRSRLFGCSNKLEQLSKIASHMVLGNHILANRVRPWNPNITVIPTALDMSKWPGPRRRTAPKKKPTVIGWIGSPLTTPYLDLIRGPLKVIARDHDILFRTIGAAKLNWADVPLDQRPWRQSTEKSDVDSFDIGVMPLSDDLWSQSKCGTKIIQYFAAAIPVIASPVGMNSYALDQGRAGLLASTENEWIEAFQKLITEPELYVQLSVNGRARAEQIFDVRKQAKVWRELLFKLSQ
jgi:glycosyltransferase involved in cell wall biosynthesis